MTRALAVLMLLAGCAARPALPPVHWGDEADVLRILRQRVQAVRTMTGQGLITLERPDGESVRLDLAVVSQPPDVVRIRAWKLGRAVLDLTLTPQGMWLYTPEDPSMKERARKAGASAAQIAQSWSTLTGGLFLMDDIAIRDTGGELLVTGRSAETTIECHIDRHSLAPRRYVLSDPGGGKRFTLELDDYRAIAGVPIAHRHVATSSDGTIRIALREIELNGELAPEAFTPPRRAEKLP